MNQHLHQTDICMFVHNDVSRDGRVLREAASLAASGWKVVVVGLGLAGRELPVTEVVEGFTIIRVTPRLLRKSLPGTLGKLLRLLVAIPAVARQIRAVDARAYHGHDFVGLVMMALAGIWRRPVVYDSHELFFDRYPKGLFTYPLKYVIWTLRPLEKILARRAAAFITVSDGLADKLALTLNVPRPLVLRNAADLRGFTAPVIFEPPPGKVLAHSGVLSHGRHLSELVQSLSLLPDDVSLALIGDGGLQNALEAEAVALGVRERLLMVYPVTPDNITPTLAQADAAAVLTSPDYEIALPNKFFEAVAAGIPVIGTRLPEVARLIQHYDLGVLCDPKDPASIAAAVKTLFDPVNYPRFRANAARARAELNWEAEEKKLVGLYAALFEEMSG